MPLPENRCQQTDGQSLHLQESRLFLGYFGLQNLFRGPLQGVTMFLVAFELVLVMTFVRSLKFTKTMNSRNSHDQI